MSNTFIIRSKLVASGGEKLVADIALSGPHPGLLDAYSLNKQDNQIWEAVADSAHPGYFFLQSLQSGNPVIDIKGVTEKTTSFTPPPPLDAYTQKSGWYENQLWTVVLDPGSTPNLTLGGSQQDFIFIESYLADSSGVPLVMDIQDWSPGTKLTAGTSFLDAFHQKSTNTDNQLWALDPHDWPKLAPTITAFTPDIDLSDPTKSTVTVSGSGFHPGATLLFTCAIEDGGFAQPPAMLGVSDFAGNFSMTATLIAWGLAEPGIGGVVNQVGTFIVGVAGNSGPAPRPVLASANAHWDGIEFSKFKHG